MVYQQILDHYKICGSIKQTAAELQIGEPAVRKVLITEGIWTSPRIEMIMSLREAGLNDREIAEKLHISISCVNNNSPYSKGTYLEIEKSLNAQRIKKCREKKTRRKSVPMYEKNGR